MRSLILTCLVLLTGIAQAEIYECVEPNGSKLFTSDPKEAKAKGCKAMNLGPPNTISSAKPEAKAKAKAARPADFPKVDNNTQKQRDNERRKILEQELANEQKLLAQAQKELAEQESIRLGSERNYQRVLDRLGPFRKKVKLHEDNIANLNRELAATK